MMPKDIDITEAYEALMWAAAAARKQAENLSFVITGEREQALRYAIILESLARAEKEI